MYLLIGPHNTFLGREASLLLGPDTTLIRKRTVIAICYYSQTLHFLGREVSLHSGGRTSIMNLQAELAWASEKMPLRPLTSGRFTPNLGEVVASLGLAIPLAQVSQ